MNILDENVRQDQRSLLQAWGTVIRVSHAGFSIARRNITEETYINW